MEKLTGELERRELEQFRAVEREKTRWEKREELLQHQVKLLRETRRTEINRRTEDTPPRVRVSVSVQTDRGSPSATTEVQSQREDDTAMGSSESTPNVGEEPATSMLTSALLAHQLPPLSKFTGEGVHGSEGDTFGDWLEQFELCAGVCQWDARAKLLNLVTRLKGAAYSFYKSCSVQHRSDYGELVKELTCRFTPVCIQAVQCSLFHERKQSGKESVDDFSQDLRKLFAHAYPKVEQGSREAEAMGKSVLANQFVAGLRSEIKGKVVGMEGSFEELLVKARFEEAKLRDLAGSGGEKSKKVSGGPVEAGTSWSGSGIADKGAVAPGRSDQSHPGRVSWKPRCFTCGSFAHMQRECPDRTKRVSREAVGQKTVGQKTVTFAGKMAAVSSGPSETKIKKVEELRQLLREAEAESALDAAVATMHHITNDNPAARLGPVTKAVVEMEGAEVNALLDTGSPVTIVSMSFLLSALAKQRAPDQTPEEWRRWVEARLQPPTLTLKNYGGGQLFLLRQIKVSLKRGDHAVEATIMVQKDPPEDLLVGTDLLSQLGYTFQQLEKDGGVRDLLKGEQAVGLPEVPMSELPFSTSGTVHLLQAVKLPPRNARVVRVEACGASKDTGIFEADLNEELQSRGVTIAETLVEPNEEEPWFGTSMASEWTGTWWD